MRIARSPVLAAAVVLVSTVAPAAGTAPNVQAAAKTLQGARDALAAAVKKIEADPPSNADLDAAHAAVGALKDAIDFGASQEPNDLDYAKAALAARKELRTQRDFVDARRAKVKIFDSRRAIDAAVSWMKEKAKAVEAKEPSAADFEAARAAVAAVKKAADEGRPYVSQDAAFASYLANVDSNATATEKAVDDKWALLEGDKHRAKVEEARLAFTKAMSVLSPKASDDEFKEADKAGKLLEQRLDEGKVLEGKDKNYGPYAAKTRSELAASRKKADELWSATGLARLKAEIEPAAKDLQAAARNVRGRKPTEDQLAEARTVTIVVRKLIEKFAPEAQRSAEFGQYVETVKGTLVEVEGLLQLRALDAALRDFRAALVKLDRKKVSDDDFQVANSSLLVLEKTLEPMNAKDPQLAAAVQDARTWQRDGKATITKRRTELDVEAQKALVETARASANVALDAFQKQTSGADDVKAAETAVANVGTALEKGTELIKRDREYAAYDREIKKRIEEFNKKIAARKLFLTAQDVRQQLADALTQAKDKIAAARLPAATDADLDAAMKSVDAVTTFLDSKAQLETQAGSYASAAERGRMELMKRMEALEYARQDRDLRKRTADQYNPGVAAFDAAQASQDLRAQKANYEKALALFKGCKEEGAKILEANPASGRLAVIMEGRPGTLKEVATACNQRFDQTSPLIKPLAGLIAFDEGPKKAYELAVQLMKGGKKNDALAQYDECTATGVTLQHRNPELKDRSFTVAGAPMTLGELTKACSAKSKELRGK